MHIKDNLINFLYDKKYFISFYENSIYCFNYNDLVSLSDDLIILSMDTFKIKITGSNLCIKKMSNKEILINGVLESIGLIHE